jgi:energy-coupling factor transport system permease protein
MRKKNITIFRYVERKSPIHNLWGGTKIISMVILTIALILLPNWISLGLFAVFIFVLFKISKLPKGVFPIIPWSLVILILGLNFTFSFFAGGSPIVHIGHTKLMLGGLLDAVQFSLLTAEFIVLLAIVGWTTPIGEVSTTMSQLAKPFRVLGAPVVEYVSMLSLAVRCIPIIIEELRILGASRKLQGFGKRAFEKATKFREIRKEAIDSAVQAIAISIRRSQEIGDAIVARGGYTQNVGVPRRPERNDFVAFGVVFVFITLIGILTAFHV